MSHKVQLGRKLKDMIPTSAMGPMSDSDTHYPTLHIDDHDDTRLLNMPDEGEAKVKYKVKSREQREHTDEKGKKQKRCSMCLEVHHIEHEEKAPKKSNSNDEARASAKNYFDKL